MKQNGGTIRTRFLMGSLVPIMLLGACATVTEEEDMQVLLPEAEQLAEEEAAAEGAPAMRRRPAAAGPRKPLPPLTLTSIVGRDEENTVELLGQPAHVRVESPATIWTYSRGNCDLEIYFYPSLRERRLQSLTYEIKERAEETDCLEEFGLAENGTS
ncbi:MAG TPA: hypothetical protein VK035_11520 [Kiloniellales bacterium]|nr:hypothetical protein [Kiloniellales bacterium]